MRRATRIVTAAFGVFVGFGGVEHGYFEILQGSTRPASVMVASMGPPCVPEEIWNLCEPALTIIPNFLVTGIVAATLGVATMIWAVAFVQRRHGGLVLALLSLGLLLFGGGLIPPVIGMIGGMVGTRIQKPLRRRPGPIWRTLALMWPWALVAFFGWLLGQFVVGYYFNEFFMANAVLIALIPTLLVASLLAAYAHDVQQKPPAEVWHDTAPRRDDREGAR